MNDRPETGPTPDAGRLDSWKEIAAHLGRDVRTVQRWEKTDGLPVRRVPGGRSRSVFALTGELDAWIVSRPKPRPRRWVLWAAAAAVIIAVAFTVLGRARARGPLTTVVARGGTLVGLDDRQRDLWSVAVPESGRAALASDVAVMLTDLDGDGERDAIARVRLQGDHATGIGDVLYSITESGKVRWSRRLDDRLVFRSGAYESPWVIRDMVMMERGPSKRIALAAHHSVWWPGIIATLDGDGRTLHRFVNSGWITQLELTRDGRFLLGAGVNNAHDSAALVVLDPDAASGTSPEEAGSPFECLNCPIGTPHRYFLLPRSELNRVAGTALLKQTVDILDDGAILLRIPQDPASGAEALYEFSPDLELRRASLADVYWDWHRRLEAQKLVDHPAERCPERRGLDVTSWERARGWRTWTIPWSANAPR